MFELVRDPSEKQLRQFGWLLVPGFAAFSIVVLFRFESSAGAAAAAIVGSALFSIYQLGSGGTKRRIWMAFSFATYPIGVVVGGLILASLYYLVLTPVALGVRGFRMLRRNDDHGEGSYWTRRTSSPTLDSYLRPY